MLLGGRFGHQQEDEQADRLFIRRIKAYGASELKHRRHGGFQAFDAAMGNGHAVAQARGAQALAGEQAVGNQGAREAMQTLKQQSSFFKRAFFAGGVHPNEDLGGRQDGG